MVALFDILFVVALSGVAVALGCRLFRATGYTFSSGGEEIVFAFGLGDGIFSLLTLFAGVFGWLYPSVFYGTFLLLLAALLWGIVADRGKFTAGKLRQVRWGKPSPVVLVLGGVIFIAMVMNLIGALAPPTEADTLAYHFAYPKQFVRAHKILYIPDFVANAPLNQHMLYTMAFLLRGETVATLLVYAQGLALVAAIILFCRKYLTWRIGVLAAALVYTMPVITYMAGSGMVELGLTLFTFLAFWTFYEWTQTMETRRLILAAIFTGLAIGTKYYGLISLAAFGLLIPVSLFLSRRFSLKKLLVASSLFGLISVGVGSASYIRNTVNTGNPFYPAFYGIFGGRDWSPELNEVFKSMLADEKRRGGNDLLSFILAPWNMTVHGDLFGEARTGFGPVFLAFTPLVIWQFFGGDKSERFLIGYILLFSAIFFTLWFWMAIQRPRHLLPIMPGMSIATSSAAFLFARRSSLIKWTTASAVAVVLGFNLGGNLIFSSQFIPVVFGAQSREVFLKSKVPNYEDLVWINKYLKDGHKILHFGRANNYYLDVSYYFGSTVSQGRIDWARTKNVEDLIRGLKIEGITHLWINEHGLRELAKNGSDPGDPVSLNQEMARLLLQLVENYAKEVYRSESTISESRTFGGKKREIQSRIYQIE